MSSNNGLTTDHMVTLKVVFEATVRRTKLPLRVMIPRCFEEHIRVLLGLLPETRIKMERWSDSLGAYIELSSDNPPVYRQLYRAAKAKSKLKLRVSREQTERTIPRPVTIEDVPEGLPLFRHNSAEPVPSPQDFFANVRARRKRDAPKPDVAVQDIPEQDVPEQDAPQQGAFEQDAPEQDVPEPDTPENDAPGQDNLEQDAPESASEAVLVPSELKTAFEESSIPASLSTELPLRFSPLPKISIPDTVDEPEVLPELDIRDASLSSSVTKEQEYVDAPSADTKPSSSFDPLSQEWMQTARLSAPGSLFSIGPSICPSISVCCNNCNQNFLEAHYHCSTCDDGDFDICQSCVDNGITCKGDDHWLIKRSVVDGQLVNSSTETIAPKKKEIQADNVLEKKEEFKPPTLVPHSVHTSLAVTSRSSMPLASPELPCQKWGGVGKMRTCNSCVLELPEKEFLHCMGCEDFDLCKQCFARDNHGHHPKHVFEPAVAGAKLPDSIKAKMGAGRNQFHQAICDGCDKLISGVRHKCLDCPDWDYCAKCIPDAQSKHPDHRFVPLYEPISRLQSWPTPQPVHIGICCDGPLCTSVRGNPSYIRGIRYKCAVCNDTDFCANCEANPSNDHNKTHPLIKFKTPVRHVSVTTTGEHMDGKRMPPMGDRGRISSSVIVTPKAADSNSMNSVQTVVDVKPEEAPVEQVQTEVKAEQEEEKEEKEEKGKSVEPEMKEETKPKMETPEDVKPVQPVVMVGRPYEVEDHVKASFVRDSVADGTILPPNHVFEQTWVLRNDGQVPWPAGCSVKFVGGDYMGHVDSAHPAGISELVSASESTVCYAQLAPGNEFPFTVLLRTPLRSGKIISYWRLTTPGGLKFGHRLWCEVSVRATAGADISKGALPLEVPKAEESSGSDSVMIFPKLEKESPHSSVHEEVKTESVAQSDKDVESDIPESEEWDGSDGFTDEEYDILDASDEE